MKRSRHVLPGVLLALCVILSFSSCRRTANADVSTLYIDEDGYIEQLIDSEQTASLGLLLKYAAEHLIDGKRTIDEIIAFLASHLEKEGLAFFFDGYTSCGYAIPRIQEIYSCFNRCRRP